MTLIVAVFPTRLHITLMPLAVTVCRSKVVVSMPPLDRKKTRKGDSAEVKQDFSDDEQSGPSEDEDEEEEEETAKDGADQRPSSAETERENALPKAKSKQTNGTSVCDGLIDPLF